MIWVWVCCLGVGERGDWREHVLSHRQTLCYENNDRLAAPKETKATHYTFTQTAKYVYIYRAEAGGSPEANCNLIVWIWKMLILYCVLQCFLPSLESVPSVKVSMSARINSEFVRAEK